MRSLFKFSLCIIAAASIQSCKKDFLNRPPQDQVTSGNFYQSDEEIMAGTAPLYNIVWFDYNDKAFLAFNEARAGNLNSNDRTAFIQFAVSATDQGTLLPGYKSFYKIIAQSNITLKSIKNATGASEAVKNMGIAECRFMRAMAYYNLVTDWGAVPIIFDNDVQRSNDVPRNKIEDVWEFIRRDFSFAAKNLPATATQPQRLTKWAAEGMLAKTFLTMAGINQSGTRNQAYLDSAKLYAGDVCNNSGLSLLPNYFDLFTGAYDNSDHINPNPEALFALQWAGSNNPWGINNSFQAYVAFDPKITQTGDGWGSAQGVSADVVKYFTTHPEDSIRRKATCMFNGDYYPELNQKDGGTHVTASNLSYIKKYVVGSPADNGGKGNFMAAYINTYMLRLAQVYLIYAEAVLGNNASTADPEALKYYNAVRARAKVPAKTSVTFDDIFQEERFETIMEGSFWFDIMRLYYYNPQKALDYIASEDRGNYTISYVENSNPKRYNVTFTPEYYPATQQTMYLPFPEAELLIAPSLTKEPVAFDFSELPGE